MRININQNFKQLKQSYLFSEIAKRVRDFVSQNPDKKIIRLGIGDVTQPLAPVVIDAMSKAVQEMAFKSTFRGYAPEYGYDFIREAVAGYYNRLGLNILADEVFVGDGAKSDLGNIVDILGDNKVLIPNPVYPVYLDSNVMSGRKVCFIEGNEQNGFLPMPNTSDTDSSVIYLCSPNNPTGSVYSFSQLEEWVSYALKTGSLIIFDSAYESYIHGDFPHSIYQIKGARQCSIEINSLSKMAGFTGTRCGYTIIPLELSAGDSSLNKMWARRQATKFNGVPYIVQRGAEAVFSTEGLKQCGELVDYYMQNAQIIADLLRKKGVWFTGGVSSPYIWLKCPPNMSSWQFFDYLLKEVNIVGTPGEGFGSAGEGYFRLTSYADRENTIEAVNRLASHIDKIY